jgi:tetratricopeptide (TPR) repeat protein
VVLLLVPGPAAAEKGVLVIHIRDVQDRPIAGVEIATVGDGATGPATDKAGKTRLRLAPQTLPGHQVTLQIVKAPPKRDLVFISPWDRTARVPPFENESNNHVPMVLADRAHRQVLIDSRGATAMVANIQQRNTPEAVALSRDTEADEQRKLRSLREVAQDYGFSPAEVDAAIRELGRKTKDPYEAGLVALYERDYPRAAKRLHDSFDIWKKEEARAQQVLARKQANAANAAFFLGQALYEQGQYRESVGAYREALQRRPEDAATLNALGVSLAFAAEYVEAEALFRRALAIREKALGPDHQDVAASMNYLASLMRVKGDYSSAEPLFHRALAIQEKALGPDDLNVATTLNNLAFLLQKKGDYTGAERLYRRALAIQEKAPPPNHSEVEVAKTMNNLAHLLQTTGDYAGADPLHRRALAIKEKELGPDHPEVAKSLNNVALLLQARGDYTGAEPLYRRAVSINEKALGPDHPIVGIMLANLANLLRTTGDYAEAEPLQRRALAIQEKALGPDHPDLAIMLNNLASLLQKKADYTGAEPLYDRALAIAEKTLGPNHPTTRTIRENLNALRAAHPAKSG